MVDFRKSRELDPEPTPAWFYEIRTLNSLGREDEAKSTARLLLDEHEELRDLPMFRTMLGQ